MVGIIIVVVLLLVALVVVLGKNSAELVKLRADVLQVATEIENNGKTFEASVVAEFNKIVAKLRSL